MNFINLNLENKEGVVLLVIGDKESIAKSISKCLNRPTGIISMEEKTEPSYLKGTNIDSGALVK